MKRTRNQYSAKRKVPKKSFYQSRAKLQQFRLPARQGVQSRKPEIKCCDVVSKYYTSDSTYTNINVTLINGLREGTGENERIGKKVFWRSLYINGYYSHVLGVFTNDICYSRMIVLYDRSPNSSAVLPAVTDILRDVIYTSAVNTDYESGINIDYKDRYVILRDDRRMLPPVLATLGSSFATATNEDLKIKEYIKVNLETQFSGDTAPMTITQINTGAIYLIFLSNFATTVWTPNVNCRFRYSDV